MSRRLKGKSRESSVGEINASLAFMKIAYWPDNINITTLSLRQGDKMELVLAIPVSVLVLIFIY